MNKYREEFQANGEGFQTVDEFMEIDAETADEAIGFAIDWMYEHSFSNIDGDDDFDFIFPEDMEWRAEEVEEV